MKLTIYARSTEQLESFVSTFMQLHEVVNFRQRRDTYPMNVNGTPGETIPWREGHHAPNPEDPNRREYYKFIEIDDEPQPNKEIAMSGELTWEQEQDIANYKAWQAEQAWDSPLGRSIIEKENAMSNAETTENITIEEINTMPELDPWQRDTGGISYTVFWLDPEERVCGVRQDYRDNSTNATEWHGLVLTWRVHGHPGEPDMRQWIDETMPLLIDICDGFERIWDGSNHVGNLSTEARHAKDTIEFELDNDGGPMNYYEIWDVEPWMEWQLVNITVNTTDDELKNMANAAEPDSGTVIIGDILDYITQHRDNLIADADDE